LAAWRSDYTTIIAMMTPFMQLQRSRQKKCIGEKQAANGVQPPSHTSGTAPFPNQHAHAVSKRRWMAAAPIHQQ
jgi:hypothetical protein